MTCLAKPPHRGYNLSIRSNRSLKPRSVKTIRRGPARPSRRGVPHRPPDGTRERLVRAALQTLVTQGFAGTTARAIARTGKLNQALIFYHFGGVDRLLLAALDATSRARLGRYREALRDVTRLSDLVDAMASLYEEDVRSGHVSAVQEMVAGGSSVPGLRKEVVARMEPWVAFAEEVLTRVLGGTVVERLLPIRELAFAAVSLYFGIETLTNLDGDRTKAGALFATGKRLVPLAEAALQSAEWLGDR